MINSNRKGKRGEREIVNILNNCNVVSKRISQMESNHVDKGDIEFYTNRLGKMLGSVKIGKQVPEFIYKSLMGFDFLFVKRDRNKWLVVMDIDKFIIHCCK